MKIIDLLNKIANGEEVPKKVRYNDEIYDTETGNNLSLMIYEATGKMSDDGEVRLFLNDEVEILEEEKKIPEKIEYYDDSIAWVIDGVGQLSNVDKVIIDKLNEIIDYLDYLKSKGDE